MNEYWGMGKAKAERRKDWNNFRYKKRKEEIEKEYAFMRSHAGWWEWDRWQKTKSQKLLMYLKRSE